MKAIEMASQTYILLLRGVMPTGRNKVPMTALRQALAAAGLMNVQTYIQSGNVIARSSLRRSQIEALAEDIIRKKIGADITVVARSVPQFQQSFRNRAFSRHDPVRLYFTFLKSKPKRLLLRNLCAMDFSPDRIEMGPGVIYALYATKYSDSRFNNNFFESRLATRATTRNFNTVSKLIELCSHEGP
jgi:uncharacterized protein (DUF1697 family)